MDTPNPYESPREVDSPADQHFVRRYAPLLAGGLAAGLVLSAFFPFLGVPVTLVATPAMVRATRIYWRSLRNSRELDWTDWCGFFLASMAIVLPVSLVGGIAFCCVCTLGGFVSFNLTYPGNQTLGGRLVYASMYLGLAAGLLASLFLLRQFHYLSAVEKSALLQAEHDAASDPKHSEPNDVSREERS